MAGTDMQCQAILAGLRELEGILDRPLANKALDLTENAATSRHKDLLIRLRKSLVQYAERTGDLVYIAAVGHFSSGKSSTINSLLGLWQSKDERPVGLNPTDKAITLITDTGNMDSLLGIVSRGSVPIRVQTVDANFLQQIVLADTPGTGDPHLLEQMARDFLPMCDLVLFFFSAASPLDSTDLPILSELHRRLPFIPMLFVVTRADELRADPTQPLTAANFDASKATGFLAEIVSRISLLLQSRTYADRDFILVDNKSGFNVEHLRKELLRHIDPAHFSTRLNIHSHKIHFFLASARELQQFFAEFLEVKITELARIVATAEKNIQKYHEGVTISNNNLTKSWLDHHTAIHELVAKAADRLKVPSELPASLHEAAGALRAQESAKADVARQARWVAEKIEQHVMQSGFAQIQRELSRVQRQLSDVDLDRLAPQDHGLILFPVEWTFGELEIIPTAYLSRKNDDVRDQLRVDLLSGVADAKRSCDDLHKAIHQRQVLDKSEEIVRAAQASLEQDLEAYFQNVHVYRAGVFAMTTKSSIARLGIGAELDQLETEFTDEDRESITLTARQKLFPDFAEMVAVAGTQLALVADHLRPVVDVIAGVRVEMPTTQREAAEETAGSKLPGVLNELKSELQREADDFVTRTQTRLAAVFGTVLHNYDRDLAAARRERRNSYLAATLGTGVAFVAAYAAFGWLRQSAGPSRLEVLVWGAVANLAGDGLGLALAWFKDRYPQTKANIKARSLAVLGEQVRTALEDATRNHRFTCLQASVLGSRLEKVYLSVMSPGADGWQAQAEDQHRIIRGTFTDLAEVRRKYIEIIEGFAKDCARYFEDAQRNLSALKAIAHSIKERAIEPSFTLLARTNRELRDVKGEIIKISFS